MILRGGPGHDREEMMITIALVALLSGDTVTLASPDKASAKRVQVKLAGEWARLTEQP